MTLDKGEHIVGMSILPAGVVSDQKEEQEVKADAAGPSVLLVTAQGLGKRVAAQAFRLQHRGGKGTLALTCNPGDRLVGLHVVFFSTLGRLVLLKPRALFVTAHTCLRLASHGSKAMLHC